MRTPRPPGIGLSPFDTLLRLSAYPSREKKAMSMKTYTCTHPLVRKTDTLTETVASNESN